ncbi:hypothetical protein JK364_10255 [Streptomyces sp. 110]|uniref:Uncharacterized protein n=1 Tax=Streptomyces endocoffeicus TaxID=2898945 RepID=A0ABS1PK53_9ACTN|nr:hypothetical protein [Streptomyces endocoffeicus]MBL1112774.1 hypothetical protein [Streptomyces endocoffeicus]
MPVEFIGTISTRDQPEIRLSGGRVIDYHGQYYQVENHYSGVKPAQQPRIRLSLGGSSSASSTSTSTSEAAYLVGGKHADTCALWGEPLAESAGVAA